MSRLIDADALIEKMDDKYTLGECGRRERDDVVTALEFAPTVSPKRGRWIVQDGAVRCSECGEPNIEWDYCPNCGALMREDGGEG